MEWWLEHRHGWLVKRQWAGSWLGRVTRDEYQVLGSTSIPARIDTLVYWESFSWLTSVGTTRNTVNRLGWSRIGLAVLILNAAGAGLIGRPAVISGRYNKCHSLQLQNYLCLSHIQPRAPYDFYHPYDFLPVRPSDAPVGILHRCCSRGHIRLRARTVWHGCTLMVWSNNSQDSTGTPCGARTGIVRAPHGNLPCFSYPTGPVRDPQGCRTAAVRTRKGIDTIRIGKTPARASYLAVRGPYGPRTGCSRAV